MRRYLIVLALPLAALAGATWVSAEEPEPSTETPEHASDADEQGDDGQGSDHAQPDANDKQAINPDHILGGDVPTTDDDEPVDLDAVDLEPIAPLPTVPAEEGAAAFVEVASVLQSPRCMNCHPAGDRPLQTDESVPHALNISRTSFESGLECSTCHGETNTDVMGIFGGPPGAPHWQLPPKETPMIFEGLNARELCEQLNRPEDTGDKDLQALLDHVTHDPLVLWGWDPGGDRTLPPLDHATFVERFDTWVNSGGACPE